MFLAEIHHQPGLARLARFVQILGQVQKTHLEPIGVFDGGNGFVVEKQFFAETFETVIRLFGLGLGDRPRDRKKQAQGRGSQWLMHHSSRKSVLLFVHYNNIPIDERVFPQEIRRRSHSSASHSLHA